MISIPYSVKSKIPNILTLARMLVIPVFVWFMYMNNDVGFIGGGFLFGLAAITDTFDGYLARHWQAQSMFGTFFDPMADKLLVITALVMLVATRSMSGIHVLPALLIITREVFMSGAREFLAHSNRKVAVTMVSKWKMAVQCFAVFCCILQNVSFLQPYFIQVGNCFIWLAAIITIYTLIDYIMIMLAQGK